MNLTVLRLISNMLALVNEQLLQLSSNSEEYAEELDSVRRSLLCSTRELNALVDAVRD